MPEFDCLKYSASGLQIAPINVRVPVWVLPGRKPFYPIEI
jgi:hypothetical protein